MPTSRALSIRYRLLAFVSGLVLVVALALALLADRAMRRAAEASAHQRLTAVVRQLQGMLATSATQLGVQVDSLARSAAIVTYLHDASGMTASGRDSLRTHLQSRAARIPFVAGVELWDSRGRRALIAGAAGPAESSADAHALIARLGSQKSAAIGWIRRRGDSLSYPAIARVTHTPVGESSRADGRDAEPIGYVVEWHHVSQSAEARQNLSGLIGTGSQVFIGNTGGDVWTNLAERVAAPRVLESSKGDSLATVVLPSGDGRALIREIPGTPWTLVLAFPESELFAPVHAMDRQFAQYGALLMLLSAAFAIVISIRVTRPILELVEATTAMKAGDYSRRVRATRSDEIGRLGHAFNAMADRVAEARQQLAASASQLQARATELRESNDVLQQQTIELETANEQQHQQAIELEMTIEQLREAEESLAERTRQAEQLAERHRAVLESIQGGLLSLDSHWRVTYVNSHYLAFLGESEASMLGVDVLEKFPVLVGTVFEQQFRRTFETGTPSHFTAQSLISGRWMAMAAYPAQDGGISVFARDVSAQHSLEEQFRQSQKMEAVGQLAGGVAHDFNNLLTAITSFAQFAAAELPPKSRAYEDLEQVQAAADRATALTRQLLAFSRRQVLQPRVLDLNRVISGLAPMLRRLIGEHIEFVVVPSPKLAPVYADPNQIEQVLLNLVVNARDAMPDGGRIVLETANVQLDSQYAEARTGVSPGAHVMFAVSDTGIGMDAETQSRLFEPFFTTKGVERGTGLGLSTVYGIVKQSGGSIYVYSELARGATFKIYLPRHEGPDVRATPQRTVIAIERRAASIVLVEDDPQVAAAAQRTLEREGYQVYPTSDGHAALSILASLPNRADLLITDLLLPKLGGRELARRVREQWPTLPILFISGYTPEAANQQGVLSQDEAFLDKPFAPSVLARRVAELLNGSA